MSLCQSIDMLAMAFLDDELAAEERRELELHLLGCASCRGLVESERSHLALVRKALAPPPAPDLLKARIALALDAEDAAVARRERRRWSQWLLPGSAMAAAAAAIAMFFGAGTSGVNSSSVTTEIAQRPRTLPLEVQGASTGGWLRDQLGPVEPPQFREPGIELLGALRLPGGISGHDAVELAYRVTLGDSVVRLNAIVIKNVRGDELNHGQAVQVGSLVLQIQDMGGVPAVTYVDPATRVGYVFLSPRMSASELVELVVSSDVIARAQGGR